MKGASTIYPLSNIRIGPVYGGHVNLNEPKSLETRMNGNALITFRFFRIIERKLKSFEDLPESNSFDTSFVLQGSGSASSSDRGISIQGA